MNFPPYLKAIRSGNALNFETTLDVVLPEGFESLEDDTFNIVDSIYLPSTVKEVASYGGAIDKFVPPIVQKLTYEKYGK